MISRLQEKQAEARAAQERRQKEGERLQQVYAAVFSTEDGREVLKHLQEKYDPAGRAFLPVESGVMCPYRAAVRDGERAVLNHMLAMIRKGEKS